MRSRFLRLITYILYRNLNTRELPIGDFIHVKIYRLGTSNGSEEQERIHPRYMMRLQNIKGIFFALPLYERSYSNRILTPRRPPRPTRKDCAGILYRRWSSTRFIVVSRRSIIKEHGTKRAGAPRIEIKAVTCYFLWFLLLTVRYFYLRLCIDLIYIREIGKQNKTNSKTNKPSASKSYGRDCASGIAGAIKLASVVLLACRVLLTDFRSVPGEKKGITAPKAKCTSVLLFFVFVHKKH